MTRMDKRFIDPSYTDAGTRKRHASARQLLVNTALVVFSICFTTALFDLAVHFLPKQSLPAPLRDVVQQMEITRGEHFINHRELGSMINPASDFIFPGTEFRFRFHTPLDYPDAGFRGGTLGGPAWGAAFGDSFTFGAGVELQATWVARLAELTNREIINFGVPGHGPYQYTKIFEKYGAPLRPKVVFYALFTNDLEDARRFEGKHESRQRGFSPKRFFKNYSVSHNAFRNLWRSLRPVKSQASGSGLGVKLLDRKLRDPYGVPDAEFASVWSAITRQIERAVEASQRSDATFVLLYFPSKEEVYWELAKERVAAIPGFSERIARLQKTAANFCQARKLRCLDLSSALKARAQRGELLYFAEDIHWNEKGNLLAAQEIHRFLADQNLIH